MNTSIKEMQPVRYLICIIITVIMQIILHEVLHITAALLAGVPLSSLKIGLLGINPSITLTHPVTERVRLFIYYAGGMGTGIVLLFIYLLYWLRRFKYKPSLFHWVMGLATIVLTAGEFATGYLEGCFHSAYIASAVSLLSPVYLLIFGWSISAALIHGVLCPLTKIKNTQKRVKEE